MSLILAILLTIPLISGISFSTVHMEKISLEKHNALDINGNPIDDKVTPSDSGWMYTSGTGKRAIKTGSKTWGYFDTRGKWRCSFNQNVTSYTYDYMRVTSDEEFVWLEREVTGAYQLQPDIARLTLTGRVLDPIFQVAATTNHVYFFYGNGKWSIMYQD